MIYKEEKGVIQEVCQVCLAKFYHLDTFGKLLIQLNECFKREKMSLINISSENLLELIDFQP